MRRDAVEVETGKRQYEPRESLDGVDVVGGNAAPMEPRVDLDLHAEHDPAASAAALSPRTASGLSAFTTMRAVRASSARRCHFSSP